jgi:hypothetical protein
MTDFGISGVELTVYATAMLVTHWDNWLVHRSALKLLETNCMKLK